MGAQSGRCFMRHRFACVRYCLCRPLSLPLGYGTIDRALRAYLVRFFAPHNVVSIFAAKTETMKYFFAVALLLAVVIAALDALHRWAVDFLNDVFRMR